MNTKSQRVSHISSLTAKAAIACLPIGMAGTMLAVLGMTASAASASIIYQQSFSGGSSSTQLNGASLTVDNGTSATWTADPQWMLDGSVVAYDNGSSAGDDNAYLAFTPASDHIYTLSEGVDATSTGNMYAGAGPAFFQTVALQTALSTGAGPWMTEGEPGSGGNEITAVAGPGNANGSADAYQGTGVQDLQMVLNTSAIAWTVQFLDNGVAEQPIFTYTTNPTIAYVGFGTMGTNAQMSNFELTSTATPEPATLGLVAVGGLGLLLIRRRKTV